MDPSHNAIVTLDVLHSGIIWGWLVTMNFWSKSIATGVFLLGAFLVHKSPARAFYRLAMPALAFVFINVTLLFTVLDLHQMFRFWHMFVHPHFTSTINLGAWVLSAYNLLTLGMVALAWRKADAGYDRLVIPGWVLAFLATIYTAGLMGQANARELWQGPTEVAQMLASAVFAGSAAYLLAPGSVLGLAGPDDDERRRFAWGLGLSAVVGLTIYVFEVVFAPQKSEEAAFLVDILTHGELATLFWSGLGLGFLIPAGLVFVGLGQRSPALFRVAAVLGLVGLWMVKHAWLLAPQLIPLS